MFSAAKICGAEQGPNADLHPNDKAPQGHEQLMKRRSMSTLIIVVTVTMAVGIAGTFVLSLSADRPADLGVHDGRLADLPSTPNCVSTYATDELHSIQPLTFDGDPAETLAKISELVHRMPRTTFVESNPNYLHVEFRSRLFRFVDDVEFCMDAPAKQIHFRSASRTGHSDLGVNRARMEHIRELFQHAQQNSATDTRK